VDKINNRVEIPYLEYRDTKAAPCDCGGYADAIGDVTKEEIKQYQTCGRSFACCIESFKCRLCKKRFLRNLPAPECD
jgi:hypothetical protein